jgi:hypothetical protein
MWNDYWVQWVVQNLLPNLIWGVPAFTTHHILIRRHITRTCGGSRG